MLGKPGLTPADLTLSQTSLGRHTQSQSQSQSRHSRRVLGRQPDPAKGVVVLARNRG